MILVAESYLRENIDEQITIKPVDGKTQFPVYLRSIYKFYEMRILDIPCVLLEILDEAPGVDMLEKHIQRVEGLTNQQIVLYYKTISRYRRKSLLGKRIPFIIEDGQIFLPFLGLHLKKTPQYIIKETKQFSTSAQLAFLFFLYNKDAMINTTEFAKIMGFTTMTASRALNELYDARLVTYKTGGKTGRSKEYKRISDPEYFEKGREFVKSPVRQVVYVPEVPEHALIAGLEALAERSMINPPGYMVRAISSEYLDKHNVTIIQNKDIVQDQKPVELEIWEYDPKLFSDEKCVDLMSLYASLKEEHDERIKQALDEILRGTSWYTD